MRILLVEDEAPLRETLAARLKREGYAVDAAQDGEEGLYMGREVPFDVGIIDLGLPKMSGMELIKALRDEGKKFPVLILTARSSWQDKVDGLKQGADDYLVKPFSFAELLARVRIILRRGHPANEGTTLTVADLELDLLRRRVSRSGKRVDLTAKEFGLLELLMRRHGEVLPRSLIASQVWDMNFDSDTNVIEVAMRRLRVKIDEGHSIKLIQTVRGMGYVLEVPEEE